MKKISTLSVLHHIQSKLRLIRAIHLYKLKFEDLAPKEDQETRLDLSRYDLLLEEIEEHILALKAILKVLKNGKTEEENQFLIRNILTQLPPISKEMHQFVTFLHCMNSNIHLWLKSIAPEIPARNLTGQVISTKKTLEALECSEEEQGQFTEAFNQYSQVVTLLRRGKNIPFVEVIKV
ncbi:MAG: hypothetical protein ACEPOZ_21340 [Marinifilaceae bacterium]